MGNLLQMSITSGQDTDSRQFTLAANSHRLAGETYDANGNRTSGSADGFTSVSYNILNLPETVTAGGRTINYLYSAAGAKLRERVILSASEESVTDYAGNTVFRDSVLHKVLTGSGYLETTDSLQTLLSHPGYRFFITDHLGSVRVVADAQGNVLQRNVYHPYGEDYAAVYAQGGNILDGLNIGSNAQPGGEGTPEGEGEPEIDDPEPGASVGGGGPDDIEDDGEEAAADEAPLAWPQYYRSFNPYRFSAKEQMTVYGGSLVGSNFEPNAGLYDFGARWYAPYSARWSTPDPLAEKYYSISPYAYCAANPVNIVDPSGRNWYSYTDSTGTTQYKYVEGQMSKAELKNGKYKDLGYTYCDNNTNTYYSLFGKILPYSSDLEFTLLGHFYEIIDQLIIAHCKYVIDNEKYYRFGGEDLTEPSIDYSINGLRAGSYNFSYNGLTFSSEKRGTIFRAIEQNGVVFRGLRIIGDRYVKTTLFPTYETTRACLNQNPLIDSGWKGYFIVAQPRSGKSFDSIQILFDKQNATSFLKSCNMLFGTDF